MADTTSYESFEAIVEWAYRTLPKKIRDLPDFPGIQVVDEPPADVLKDIANKKKGRRVTELLGLYSGTFRTKRSFAQVQYAPDLIFVFRRPIRKRTGYTVLTEEVNLGVCGWFGRWMKREG